MKAGRKAVRKSKKLLDLSEERCYQIGYDQAVRKAHEVGLQHTLVLEEGDEDPVGREDVDEVTAVSSGEDEDLTSD